jgi:hypothetical protein
MITDEQIDELFAEFLASPELSSWESDLSGPEHDDAERLFRETVRKAIEIYREQS